MRPLSRMGEDIGEGELERLAALEQQVEDAFATLVVPACRRRRRTMRMQPRVTVHDAAMRLEGPLLFMRRTLEVGLNEAVVVSGRDGAPRLGRVAAIDEDLVTIEMLDPTAGLGLAGTVVRFLGEPIDFGVGPGRAGPRLQRRRAADRQRPAARRWRSACASTACR